MIKLEKSASTVEIFAYLEAKPFAVVLFIDQSKFCQQYSDFPWVQTSSSIVEIDQDILETFQIGKVPQYRFYIRGNEIAYLIGTATREQFEETYEKVFGNLAPLR